MTTAKMIEQAAASKRLYGYLSSAVFETKAGKIACFVDHSKGNARSAGTHMAVRFNLNGKPISRAHLESVLAQ